MQIFIDNKIAVLKEDTSFEYTAENRLFTGADVYTMEISLPLAGCRENIEIFGRLFRKDIRPEKLMFDCEIRDGDFVKFGCIAITEFNESEVKVQFLEGRSVQNYDTSLDDIFINELDLGQPQFALASEITAEAALDPTRNNYEAVCLPWVNGSGSSTIIHNEMERDMTSEQVIYKWGKDVKAITWQPYLLSIAKKICEQTGYTHDFSWWENDETKKYFIVCNTLPDGWDINGYARALPHWSVEEFFTKLEEFLGGEFTIDHKARHISFSFSRMIDAKTAPVTIDEVVDEFTAEVDIEDSKCDYIECRNILYKDQNNEMWKFYSCDWYVELMKNHDRWLQGKIQECATVEELISIAMKYQQWDGVSHRKGEINNLFYVRETDSYYIFRYYEKRMTITDSLGNKHWIFFCFPQSVNAFGQSNYENDDVEKKREEMELEFVPVCIDYTDNDHGKCMFLFPGSYSEDHQFEGELDIIDRNNDDFQAPLEPLQIILNGDQGNVAEYYSNIFVGYWKEKQHFPYRDKLDLPHPLIEGVTITRGLGLIRNNFSLRLNDGSIGKRYRGIDLDIERKYTFKFLSDTIPSPRAVFFIRGKKYLCESLTCVFTDRGRSNLIKGEFWAVKE